MHVVTLLILHAEYITKNAGLDEAQAGIKIAGRNINNRRYAEISITSDTTLMTESEEELKTLLMKVKESESEKRSRSVVSNSLRPHGLQIISLLCSWDFLGKNTGVGCHFLLQEIFPTQGLNLGLPHCRQTLYHLSHQGSQESERGE